MTLPVEVRWYDLQVQDRILIVNGSLGGSQGNTSEILALAEESLEGQAQIAHLDLSRNPSMDRMLEEAARAAGFIFGTGTYWESWGSPLQSFFEMTAHTEGDDCWFGKPAVAFVTAHAVGSRSVLSRLFGTLNSFGMLIPPYGGLTYTKVNDLALQYANEEFARELWTPNDVAVVTHNLLQAVRGGTNWRQWPVNSGSASDKWLTCYSGREATE